MEDNTIKWSEVKRKIAFEQFKFRAKDKINSIKNWCNEHREEAITIGIICVSAGFKFYKAAKKSHDLKVEKELKDTYIYDRSMGHYWKCRKKPTTEQYLEIERRKANGEGLGTILTDMRLL